MKHWTREHVAAAEGDAMREHHPPFAWMHADLSFAERERHSVGPALLERQAKYAITPSTAPKPTVKLFLSPTLRATLGFTFVSPGASCAYASTAASMGS